MIEESSPEIPKEILESKETLKTRTIYLIVFCIAIFLCTLYKYWPEKKSPVTPINNNQQQIINKGDTGSPRPVQQNNTNGQNVFLDNSTTAPVTKITKQYYLSAKKPDRHLSNKDIDSIVNFIPGKDNSYPILIFLSGENSRQLANADSLGQELKNKLSVRGFKNVGFFRLTQNWSPDTLRKFSLAKDTNFVVDPTAKLRFPKVIVGIFGDPSK